MGGFFAARFLHSDICHRGMVDSYHAGANLIWILMMLVLIVDELHDNKKVKLSA